jgi:hypothetical protein
MSGKYPEATLTLQSCSDRTDYAINCPESSIETFRKTTKRMMSPCMAHVNDVSSLGNETDYVANRWLYLSLLLLPPASLSSLVCRPSQQIRLALPLLCYNNYVDLVVKISYFMYNKLNRETRPCKKPKVLYQPSHKFVFTTNIYLLFFLTTCFGCTW